MGRCGAEKSARRRARVSCLDLLYFFLKDDGAVLGGEDFNVVNVDTPVALKEYRL